MKAFTTTSGNEIKVSANKGNRTFTIRKNGSKYRTIRLTKQEFEECDYMSANDWDSYLKYDSNYYVVK